MKVAELFEQVKVTDRFKLYDFADITDDTSIERLAEVIKQNCKTMLDAYKKAHSPLYRGINTEVPEYKMSAFAFITGIRNDRKPVQMDNKFHDELHDTFLDMGIDVTRKNSIFCTAWVGTAGDWGTPTIIFVKDGWKGLVFENRKSGYAFGTFDSISRIYPPFRNKALRNAIVELKPKIFSTSNELAEVIDVKYKDILITGDSYIAVKVNKDREKLDKLFSLLGLPNFITKL